METNDVFCPITRNGRVERFHFNEALAKRLTIERVLKGHRLCVNRLSWNLDGSRLLSGSDDRHLLIHSFTETAQLPLSISTEHGSNIFGVQFLPYTGDQLLVSGAMDRTVQLHRLDDKPERIRRSAMDDDGSAECIETAAGTVVFGCHRGRVKDVEIDEQSPNLFWSASEDGTVRQFDIRTSFSAQAETVSPNVLIGIRSRHSDSLVDIKGLDINKSCPHQIAVACGDPFVRVFDRRKLTLGHFESTFPEPLLQLSPPHLPIGSRNRAIGFVNEERCHSTYVNFSHRGDKLISQFYSDHAYSFDITSEGTAACTYVRHMSRSQRKNGISANGHRSSDTSKQGHEPMSSISEEDIQQRICDWKNDETTDFMKARQKLDQAIYNFPNVSNFFVARANSNLERRLPGDLMFALRDCDQAIAIDRSCSEAYLRRCESIEALGQYQTAHKLLRNYTEQFPEMCTEQTVTDLHRRINDELQKQRRSSSSRRSRETDAQALTDDTTETTAQNDSEDISDDDAGPSGSSMIDEEDDCDEHLFSYYCKEISKNEPDNPGGVWWSTQGGRRLLNRYIGQRNVQTDIKECIFLGHNDSLVACGSDDGYVFIYNAETGVPVNVLKADEDVANCVQCHPFVACLATSGIGSVVRLWTPTGDAIAEKELDRIVLSSAETMKRGREIHFNDNIQMIRRVMMIMEDEFLDVFLR